MAKKKANKNDKAEARERTRRKPWLVRLFRFLALKPVRRLVLLVIALAALALIFAFRDTLTNLLAGLQLNSAGQIKVGDYIKLETGEEGYVRAINWRTTQLEALNESTIILPNSRLLQRAVVNYGRPLKQAKEPFRFNSRTHLT